MDNLISKEIVFQKLRKNPDQSYIKALQQMLDKGTLTFTDFANTGRIMGIEYYHKEFGSAPLDKKCENVCRYMSGLVAQHLETGEWLYVHEASESDEQPTRYVSKNLKEVEQFMWDNKINA
jgi:hypothetical protein